MSKTHYIATQYDLVEAVSAYLQDLQIPGLRFVVRPESFFEDEGDFRLDVRVGERRYKFAVHCRLHPSSQDIIRREESGEASMVPLLACPHLAASLVDRCREQGASCLDLNGNLYLRREGLLIDRMGTGKRYRSAELEPDLFAAKSSRLARWFLSHPGRRWQQEELSRVTGCSPALVSRLMGEYARLGWVEYLSARWQLTRADALLDAWTGADRWSKRGVVRQFSALGKPSRLAEQIMEWAAAAGGQVVFTQWFAAAQRHPYAELPVVSAYCPILPGKTEAHALGWRPVSNGGRIWLILPSDEGVFQCVQPPEETPLVCDTQIYLDLLQVGLRGPDAARALRQWKGFRQP